MKKLAVIGAGLIGERHARLIAHSTRANLVAIVDPTDHAGDMAQELGARHFTALDTLFESKIELDGVIIATPNATHRDIGIACIEQGLPSLIEKPLAPTSSDAAELMKASEQHGVPILVGHHRRHHEASQMVHDAVSKGTLGDVLAAQVTWCLRKPEDYFAAGPWRQASGAGPVWINLIHEIDLLRYFLGDVASVCALTNNKARSAAVEDCAAISMKFESGALANILVCDASPSPWHFEGASGENPNIAYTGQDGMRLFGSRGALEFPSLTHWHHGDHATKQIAGHWGTPITKQLLDSPAKLDGEAALTAQLHHFCNVIGRTSEPLVSAEEGWKTILVTEAIIEAASSRCEISIPHSPHPYQNKKVAS